ncbi:MAG: AbrB family transcriptional regulator [Acidiphilium sp.]
MIRFESKAIGRWSVLAIATILLAAGLDRLHVPSAALFAALFVATILALCDRAPEAVPPRATLAAQAVLGVLIGGLVQASTMRALGQHILPVVLVTVATLLVSIAAGLLMGLRRDVDPITGALALTTGGASAIVALAAEIGGDVRMVAVVQYLRVGFVTATMPLIVALVFHASAHAAPAPAPANDWPLGLTLLAVAAPLGLLFAKLTRMPAGPLLGPLCIGAAITLSGWTHNATVPAPIVDVAYAIIGWQAGVRFTLGRLAEIGRALPLAIVLILVVNLACAGLGVLLARLTGASAYDGYLATVPGGIYAALAMAIASRTDVTFVLAVHVLRVVMMMFAMPLFARLLRRRAMATTS